MPYANPEVAREKRKEAYARRMAADPDYQKRLYRKHREKRLASKSAAYAADPEKFKHRNAERYQRNKDKYVEYAREYRRENAEIVNARAMQRYYENRDAVNERRKGYRQKHYSKIYARIQKWRSENPEREFLYHAKRLLSEQTGIPTRYVPDELAEVKMMQLKVTRAARTAQTGADHG